DSVANIIPNIDAVAVLNNGYVKSTAYPAPIEDLNVNLSVINTTGRMNDLVVDLSSFGFNLEGESIKGRLKVNDLDRLSWDGEVTGTVDLGKIATIFPMEDVIMEGKIIANIDSRGNYQDVEASRYDRLETSGNLEVRDFYYTDLDLPQGIRINAAKGDFSPTAINLTNFDARVGQSPLTATGSLTNYMAYLFGENQTLRGNVNLYSPNFNVNEWMTGTTPTEDTTSLSVIELPRDIDFTMSVKADEVVYDNLVLKDINGAMTLRDGVLAFNNASMSTLGGKLGLTGSYDPRDVAAPAFDMTFDVAGLSIREAFNSLNTVRAFAPVAQHITGNFTTKFKMSGLLGQDMMPVLSSLDGSGLVRIVEAALRDSKIIQGITSLTPLSDGNTLTLKNLNLSLEIVDGMLQLKPFDLNLWGYAANIQGSTGFDGSLNYLISMQVPVEKFGSQVSGLVANLTKSDISNASVPLNFNVQGNYANPRISLAGGDNNEGYLTNALKSRLYSATEQVEQAVDDEVKNNKYRITEETKDEA